MRHVEWGPYNRKIVPIGQVRRLGILFFMRWLKFSLLVVLGGCGASQNGNDDNGARQAGSAGEPSSGSSGTNIESPTGAGGSGNPIGAAGGSATGTGGAPNTGSAGSKNAGGGGTQRDRGRRRPRLGGQVHRTSEDRAACGSPGSQARRVDRHHAERSRPSQGHQPDDDRARHRARSLRRIHAVLGLARRSTPPRAASSRAPTPDRPGRSSASSTPRCTCGSIPATTSTSTWATACAVRRRDSGSRTTAAPRGRCPRPSKTFAPWSASRARAA